MEAPFIVACVALLPERVASPCHGSLTLQEVVTRATVPCVFVSLNGLPALWLAAVGFLAACCGIIARMGRAVTRVGVYVAPNGLIPAEAGCGGLDGGKEDGQYEGRTRPLPWPRWQWSDP